MTARSVMCVDLGVELTIVNFEYIPNVWRVGFVHCVTLFTCSPLFSVGIRWFSSVYQVISFSSYLYFTFYCVCVPLIVMTHSLWIFFCLCTGCICIHLGAGNTGRMWIYEDILCIGNYGLDYDLMEPIKYNWKL